MKWIEVIEARLSNIDQQVTDSLLRALKYEIIKLAESHKTKLYRRFMLDNDICIQLTNESLDIDPVGSPLALQIISVLREYAQVNHKIWIEFENDCNRDSSDLES